MHAWLQSNKYKYYVVAKHNTPCHSVRINNTTTEYKLKYVHLRISWCASCYMKAPPAQVVVDLPPSIRVEYLC